MSLNCQLHHAPRNSTARDDSFCFLRFAELRQTRLESLNLFLVLCFRMSETMVFACTHSSRGFQQQEQHVSFKIQPAVRSWLGRQNGTKMGSKEHRRTLRSSIERETVNAGHTAYLFRGVVLRRLRPHGRPSGIRCFVGGVDNGGRRQRGWRWETEKREVRSRGDDGPDGDEAAGRLLLRLLCFYRGCKYPREVDRDSQQQEPGVGIGDSLLPWRPSDQDRMV